MLASSQTIAPKPAALPPAVHAPLPGSGSAGGPSFAQFLNDQPTLPTPESGDAAPDDAESAGSEATAAPAPATTRRPASPAPAKPAQNRATDAAASAKPDAAAAKRDASDDGVDTADAAQDPETSGLDEFTQLIGLTPQGQPIQALPTPVPGADAQGEAASDRHGRGRINRRVDEEGLPAAARSGGNAEAGVAAASERRTTDAPERDTAPRAKAVDLAAADKAAARSAATSSETLQTAAASGGSSTSQAAAAPTALPTSFAAVLAQAMPTTNAMADAAPTSASGQVHAALHSNAFAPELGARVSLLAVDGVQHAELQLNPADMGPVAVQIVVDGSQAQVSFHAVQAETRQALEQSLPDLAAALQSQGLTLSGGGVFQQAQQESQGGDAEAGQGGDARGSRTNTAGGSSAGSPVAAPVRRSVGLLDTFA